MPSAVHEHAKLNWNQVALAMAALGGLATAIALASAGVSRIIQGADHADTAVQNSSALDSKLSLLDQKIGNKLDVLGQQVVVIDERLSRIEGRLTPTRAADTPMFPYMTVPIGGGDKKGIDK